jgi:adenylate cyclase
VRDARLASGLVMFSFLLLHLLNHALGVFGLRAMEAAQEIRTAIWHSPPGLVVLSAAALTHILLAAHRIANRRTWRMPPLEATQIALGLLIPVWLVDHAVGAGAASWMFGANYSYSAVLSVLWPGLAFGQAVLVLVAWGHAMIGLYFWVRTRSWFHAWKEVLASLAFAIPLLALAGFVAAGREAAGLGLPPRVTPAQGMALGEWAGRADTLLMLLAGCVLAVAAARGLARLSSPRLRVSYVGGPEVKVPAGPTLLEISREANVAHASVCGGRARCSTCRVRVLEGLEGLAPANANEQAVLERIAAPASVRLACQIRPAHDVQVELLVPTAGAARMAGAANDPFQWGVERRVTVMFADLRGFTGLAETQIPYDTVFLLNRFLGAMTVAVEAHGGRVDKYLGDGLMALFGVTPQAGAGARAALLAARDMLAALERINAEFDAVTPRHLAMGIGIHMGPAILGRIGSDGRGAELTALGDTVNTASRLEGVSKELGVPCVVSQVALAASGLDLPAARPHEAALRGRAQPLAVFAVSDFARMTEGESARLTPP